MHSYPPRRLSKVALSDSTKQFIRDSTANYGKVRTRGGPLLAANAVFAHAPVFSYSVICMLSRICGDAM